MLSGHLGRFHSALTLALSAALQVACSGLGPAANPNITESGPPALALADPFAVEHTLILETDDERPAPLAGAWKVAAGDRNCSLTLVVDAGELTGHSMGCSEATGPRPIAIGLVSGSSFLFQTGRGGDGWIWSGRYNETENTLEGRREHVITGKLESFAARR